MDNHLPKKKSCWWGHLSSVWKSLYCFSYPVALILKDWIELKTLGVNFLITSATEFLKNFKLLLKISAADLNNLLDENLSID